MNIIKSKIHRNLVATIGISVLALLLIFNFTAENQTQVQAESKLKELTGYAWSSNIGWISMNCSNTSSCDQSDYKVTLDEETGNLTGEAWSSNVGWLQFGNLNTADMPTGNGTQQVNARINEDGEMEGWARFLSFGDDVLIIPGSPTIETSDSFSIKFLVSGDQWTTFDFGGLDGVPAMSIIPQLGEVIPSDDIGSPRAIVFSDQSAGYGDFSLDGNRDAHVEFDLKKAMQYYGSGFTMYGFYGTVSFSVPPELDDVDPNPRLDRRGTFRASGNSDSYGGIISDSWGSGRRKTVLFNNFRYNNDNTRILFDAYTENEDDPEIGGVDVSVSTIVGPRSYREVSIGTPVTFSISANGNNPIIAEFKANGQFYRDRHGEREEEEGEIYFRGNYDSNSNIYNNTTETTNSSTGQLAWDGWVSLSGVADDGSTYGPTVNSPMSGYAWGDDVVGWVDFSGVTIEEATAQCGAIDGRNDISKIDDKTDAQLCENGEVAELTDNIDTWTWDCIVDEGYGEGDEGSPNDYGCSAGCIEGYVIGDDGICAEAPDDVPDDPGDDDDDDDSSGHTPTATIERFEAVPRIINRGGTCNMLWAITTSDSDLISCTVTSDFAKDTEQPIQFNDRTVDGTVQSGSEGVKFDSVDATTQYTLTCSEYDPINDLVGAELDSKTARCSINPNFIEF